jgi:hypothetical protein
MLFSTSRHRQPRLSRSGPGRRPGRARQRFVPWLEVLEPRTVLSASYVFTSFDAPGAGTAPDNFQGTFAIGINNRGDISGNYGDANDVVHGFLLSHGQYTTFDEPNAGSGPFQGTGAFGLNDRGDIVGSYLDVNYVQHSFLRSGGQFTTLDDPNNGFLPFAFNEAVTVNDRGQVVGAYSDAQGIIHGYLWSGGQYTTIDVPNMLDTLCLGDQRARTDRRPVFG